MEKLVQIDKEDTYSGKHYRMYRVQCKCLYSADAMDIDVDSEGKDGERKYITLRMDTNHDSFFNRLKFAFNVFRNKWAWREFIVRQEDMKELSDIFNPDKKYSELP